MYICFLTRNKPTFVTVFFPAIYLGIAFCVLKFEDKSSLLPMLAIIGFATAIITFGFFIPLIHIKWLFILWHIAR